MYTKLLWEEFKVWPSGYSSPIDRSAAIVIMKQFECPSCSTEIIKVLGVALEGQGVMSVQIWAGCLYSEGLLEWCDINSCVSFILTKSCAARVSWHLIWQLGLGCVWECFCVVLIAPARDVVGLIQFPVALWRLGHFLSHNVLDLRWSDKQQHIICSHVLCPRVQDPVVIWNIQASNATNSFHTGSTLLLWWLSFGYFDGENGSNDESVFTAKHTKWKNNITCMHQVRVVGSFMPVELRNHCGFCEILHSSGNDLVLVRDLFYFIFLDLPVLAEEKCPSVC